MQLKISFALDNAAFDSASDPDERDSAAVADCLHRVASAIAEHRPTVTYGDTLTIRDLNGNTVGQAFVTTG